MDDEQLSLVDSAGKTRGEPELVREITLRALVRLRWNVVRVGLALGVSPVTIYNRAEIWGVDLKAERANAAAKRREQAI